ncbi:MAG: hypothetical protein GVY18_06425 [Bacteroidetes bacterium]|jgi:Zn finger protein HypA/HybF involved in hydrogenase expression|nr:hypothetical protein [Bacteroidota bacterium]
MPLDPSTLSRLARALATTQPDEIACDECFARMDAFADLLLSGKPAEELLPKIHAHLQRCPDCKEEFESLLAMLRATG